MVRTRTMRLRIHAPGDCVDASRAIDVTAITPLDVVARALRAVCHRETDMKQYRIEMDSEVFGDPGGRSHPKVRRGKAISLEKALERTCEFNFRSDLKKRVSQRVTVENVFTSIWAPEDHPLLVDVQGNMPLGRAPTRWDRLSGAAESEDLGQSRTGRKTRRIDELARHYLLELGFVRNRRRGPIRSHQSGRRGWKERFGQPPDPVEEALYRQAGDMRFNLIETGYGYALGIYSHYEQRPCLIEHVGLEGTGWCTRPECPGCRLNHQDSHLFAGSEAWTTRREPAQPGNAERYDEVGGLYAKPEGRITVRVAHPAGNRAQAIEAIGIWHRKLDDDQQKLLDIWVAPDGHSWRGPGERTAVLWQPAGLAGPSGWIQPAL